MPTRSNPRAVKASYKMVLKTAALIEGHNRNRSLGSPEVFARPTIWPPQSSTHPLCYVEGYSNAWTRLMKTDTLPPFIIYWSEHPSRAIQLLD